MRNFRELEVWKDARKLVKEIYLPTKELPNTEKYGLVSQINRCAVSITANIAEGWLNIHKKILFVFFKLV